MRYSKEHKAITRQRIVASACRLFTSKGYAATSIGEIMSGCGLTHGGFYAHFTGKAELYREALEHAAAQGELLCVAAPAATRDECWIETILSECLDARLAFLVSDAASRESQVRSAYTRALRSINREMGYRAAGRPSCGEDSVLSLTAMIIGAAAIAQTVDDAALKARLLAACKTNATALLDACNVSAPLDFFWSSADP
jgi:AcrR family transcriptional regulator